MRANGGNRPNTRGADTMNPSDVFTLDPVLADEAKSPRIRACEQLLVGSRDAAALLGIGRSSFLRLDNAGLVPRGLRLGGRHLWVVADLKLWLDLGAPNREQFEARKATMEGGRASG
jgi:predicted DNA-binding transcriptional regulator AlpA